MKQTLNYTDMLLFFFFNIKNGKLIFSGQKMRKDRFMKFRVLLKFSSFQTLLFVYGMFCKRQLNLNNTEVSYG